MGSETEVMKISGAQLFLIDREESVLMQKGDFSLRLVKQEHSPLAAIVAAVGEVQWPIGKDAPALKVWNRHYTFALPGLMVYGLLFPAETPVEVLQQLEAVMNHYCTFEVHQEIAAAGNFLFKGLSRISTTHSLIRIEHLQGVCEELCAGLNFIDTL
jgi:spartin